MAMVTSFHKSFILEPVPAVANKESVLLFHGMSASPLEMLALGKKLQALGFRVSAPLLAGHGTSIEDLRKTSSSQWLDDVDGAIELELKAGAKRLSFCGLSFGAILALYGAEQLGEMSRSLVMLAPPFKFRARKRELLLPFLSYLPNPILDSLPLISKIAKAQDAIIRPREAYSQHSIAAGARLVQIRKLVLERLDTVYCPSLVLVDPEDDRLTLAGIRGVAEILKSKVFLIDGGGHNLTAGPAAEKVDELTTQFIVEAG